MSTTRHYLKAGHRKTKTGCFKCRARRVKCDEKRPICTNCHRLDLPCGFPEESSNNTLLEDLPVSRSKPSEQAKRMELHLLHAYMSRGMVTPGGLGVASEWRNAWFVELPRLALKHDNLLYALLAFSALQLHATSASAELSLAQSEYWSLALQEQRNVVATDGNNHEATTLAAYLICMIAFGMIRERSLTPYTAPLAWFEVAQGALQVCPDEQTCSVNERILHTTFRLTVPIRHGIVQSVDELYKPILTYRLEEESQEYYDGSIIEEDIQAYEQVLALITCFRNSVAEREPAYLHKRWICSFGQVVPAMFITALRQLRPRALVILACFWAVLGNTDEIVLAAFGDANKSIPKTEIMAIKDYLPAEWRGLLQMPLDELFAVDG